MLSISSVVSLVLGMRENPSTGWIEGTAILVAVLIVVFVTAANDYEKVRMNRELQRHGARASPSEQGDLFPIGSSRCKEGEEDGKRRRGGGGTFPTFGNSRACFSGGGSSLLRLVAALGRCVPQSARLYGHACVSQRTCQSSSSALI